MLYSTRGRTVFFRTPIKVLFSDIDNAGIVYYPRFLHYFHLAMEEFFIRELDVTFAEVLHQRKVSLPTVHVQADFRRRLKYGDRIEMEVQVCGVGRTSITWGYRGFRGDPAEELVVEGSNVTVCVQTDTLEKIEVPAWLRSGLDGYTARTVATSGPASDCPAGPDQVALT